jgi:hypothetical protein
MATSLSAEKPSAKRIVARKAKASLPNKKVSAETGKVTNETSPGSPVSSIDQDSEDDENQEGEGLSYGN